MQLTNYQGIIVNIQSIFSRSACSIVRVSKGGCKRVSRSIRIIWSKPIVRSIADPYNKSASSIPSTKIITTQKTTCHSFTSFLLLRLLWFVRLVRVRIC